MSFPVLTPTGLPRGYDAVSAQTVRTPNVEGLTVVFRRPAAELDGVGLELYQAEGQTLPPPTGAGQQEVRVRAVVGRWWPDGHRLEWLEGGIYRSLVGPSFDLTTMLGIADSLRPTRGVTR
jgi:hypothetical protein